MTDHLQVHLTGDLAERVREHVPPGDRTAWIALALEDALARGLRLPRERPSHTELAEEVGLSRQRVAQLRAKGLSDEEIRARQ